MKMTLDERETNLFFNEADKIAQIQSYDARLNRRLKNLAQERPDEVKPVKEYFDDENGAVCYTFPSAWLRINPTRVSAMTDEQRKAKSEQMKALNAERRQ